MLRPAIFHDRFADSFFDSFFDDVFAPFHDTRQTTGLRSIGTMRTDIRELSDAYEIEMELPGFSKDNVKVELKNGYMTVEASRTEDENGEDAQGRYIRRERHLGSYQRSIYVGENVTEEDIRARFSDGVLKLTVPRREAAAEVEQTKYIPIEG